MCLRLMKVTGRYCKKDCEEEEGNENRKYSKEVPEKSI